MLSLQIILISLVVRGINYWDQTYTNYWKNIVSLLFFCFLFISAILFLLQKI
jgi:hypothetical protein